MTVNEKEWLVVGNCKCDQFFQVKVCRELDVDWAVSAVVHVSNQLRKWRIVNLVPHAVMMLLDVVYQQHWWIPTRLEKHTVTSKEWRPCKHASTNRHTCRTWLRSNLRAYKDCVHLLITSQTWSTTDRWFVIVMPRILMEVTRWMFCIGAGGRLLIGLRLRYTHTVCEYYFRWLWPVESQVVALCSPINMI